MDERPIEMSFRGTLRGGVRNRIFGHYLDSGTLDLESMRWDLEADGPVSPKQYTRLMRDSKFCLHVRGTRVQSPRLIEGMMFGCVPVILADGYELPMSWLFDWSKFSIRLPEIEYRRLPDVLAKVSLFLVIFGYFGYFWLFLVIPVWAVVLTTCFLIDRLIGPLCTITFGKFFRSSCITRRRFPGTRSGRRCCRRSGRSPEGARACEASGPRTMGRWMGSFIHPEAE